MRYKGIIFDLDGTLIKSTIDFVKMKRNMIKILEENGIPNNLLTPRQTTVVILETSEKIWNNNNKPENERIPVRDSLDDIMNQGEIEAIPLVKELDNTSEGIKRLDKMGYDLAILTRSHHDYAVKALEKLGILHMFKPILGRGETPKPKPYREALEYTAKLMNIKIQDLVFVGDHHIDYQCAKNAGCFFIGVNPENRSIVSWAGDKPKVILKNISELPEYFLENN